MQADDLKKNLRDFYTDNSLYHKLIEAEEKKELTYDSILAEIISWHRGGSVACLDVACGTGHYVKKASECGALGFGIDLSLHACMRARSKGTGVNAVQSDAEAMPFADNAFDVAMCLQMIEHTPYPERVVAEICRVLKPGGHLFISAPNYLGSNLLTRTLRIIKGLLSGDVKELRRVPENLITLWHGASATSEIADFDACNRTNVFHAMNLLKANGMRIERLDTMRHPKKYRPWRLSCARFFSRIHFARYHGINFKIIAVKGS